MSFHEYSAQYHPAAPVCEVFLGPARGEPTLGPLEALIDTGADITIVPLAYLRQVKARRVDRGQAKGVWGSSREVDVYAISLALNGLRFGTLRVLADERGDEIILGRLVLNRLKIILDGPAGMIEIIGP